MFYNLLIMLLKMTSASCRECPVVNGFPAGGLSANLRAHGIPHVGIAVALEQFAKWNSKQDTPELAGLYVVRNKDDLGS